jgi:hypothetical protein
MLKFICLTGSWHYLEPAEGNPSNHLFSSMDCLKDAVAEFFSWLNQSPRTVLSLAKGEKEMASAKSQR